MFPENRLFLVPALLCGLLIGALDPVVGSAQEDEPSLTKKQEALAGRYAHFEQLLMQMSEYLGRTDRERAELLIRAWGRSREDRISQQMDSLVELLRNEDFGDAIEAQTELVTSLQQLLELLQSEDRLSELEAETARIQGLLKDVNKLVGDQKKARRDAERATDPMEGAKGQQRVADSAEGLMEKIDKQDAQKAGESGDPNSKPGESSESPSKSQSGDGESQSGEGQPGETKPGESKPGEKSGQQDKKRTAGRKELEQARDAMQRAIDKLRKQQRGEATKEQDRALEELLEAREKLEERLRQLREEERELMLADLEARFKKMLAMQLVVNNGTRNLAETPRDQWIDRYFTRCRELSQLQNEIALEASSALNVLREEGTSVSFPIAVEDVREDMLSVARWLEETEVGDLTRNVQSDIVEALEEMVLALQKEMEKSGDDKQSKPCDCNGDPVLVDTIAELKMLRTLQKRVNRRTRLIGEDVAGDQARTSQALEQLQVLARRQDRIRQTAIDIATSREQ